MQNHTTLNFKQTGVAHVFAAFGYSMSGARYLLTEQAARHEVFMALVALSVFAYGGATWSDYAILGALFLLVICLEAINTAGELIIDRVSPEISAFAKQAKDILSLAVFCGLVIFFGFVLSVCARLFS